MRLGDIKKQWVNILTSLKDNGELDLGAIYDYMPADSSPMPNKSIVVRVASEEPKEDGSISFVVHFTYFHRAVSNDSRLTELYDFVDDFRHYIMEFRGLPDVTTVGAITAPNGGQIMWDAVEIRRDVFDGVDVETDTWMQGAIITVTHYTREASSFL